MGTKLGPEDSFRFARGEEVISNTGLRAKLARPIDFLVVSDHAEYLGIADQIRKADPDLLKTKYGKRWYDMYQAGRPINDRSGEARSFSGFAEDGYGFSAPRRMR